MFFSILSTINDFYWDYVGFVIVVLSGLYFTLKTNFFQFKVLGSIPTQIKTFSTIPSTERGIHPLKLYFASIGGSIGLGNIATIISALTIGGPGVLFWLWMASFCGMLIKYSEIYLGIKYREPNDHGGFNGGSLYYLKKAFNSKILCFLVAILFCIYGIEVLQFSIVSENISKTFGWNKFVVVSTLLGLVFYSAIGGVKRLANICTILMPGFMILYIFGCIFIIGNNYAKLPSLFLSVFKSAFSGHAAFGGFIGSSFILTARQGTQWAVYSGDIGVGYDSIIQSETNLQDGKQQARLSILSLFTDSFICSMSILVVLCSGLWTTGTIPYQMLVAASFKEYFTYAEYFIAVIMFLSGFTTIISFFTVGFKSARYISEKYGRIVFGLCGFLFFILCSLNQSPAIPSLIMGTVSGSLLFFNIMGILKLRNEIKFE